MCVTLIKALNKLKNASLLNKEFVYLNFDLKYFEILKVLYKEGFIQGYQIDKDNYQIIVYLRFFQNKFVIDIFPLSKSASVINCVCCALCSTTCENNIWTVRHKHMNCLKAIYSDFQYR